jgi:hypothetical protein
MPKIKKIGGEYMDKLKELMDKKAVIEAESKALIANDDATAEEITAKLAELKAINAKDRSTKTDR